MFSTHVARLLTVSLLPVNVQHTHTHTRTHKKEAEREIEKDFQKVKLLLEFCCKQLAKKTKVENWKQTLGKSLLYKLYVYFKPVNFFLLF